MAEQIEKNKENYTALINENMNRQYKIIADSVEKLIAYSRDRALTPVYNEAETDASSGMLGKNNFNTNQVSLYRRASESNIGYIKNVISAAEMQMDIAEHYAAAEYQFEDKECFAFAEYERINFYMKYDAIHTFNMVLQYILLLGLQINYVDLHIHSADIGLYIDEREYEFMILCNILKNRSVQFTIQE